MIKNLHCISLPTPFPVGPVNVYLSLDAPVTLIDTGPKDDAARHALEEGLRAHGCRVEDLEQIILTHHHVDHTGLTAELAARSHARVFTHPFNLPWLAEPMTTRTKHAPFYRRLFREGDVPEQILKEIEMISMTVAHWAEPFAGAHAIEECDEVNFARSRWTVFHTPGHAGGLICLWEPRSRTLLANDHILKNISSNAIIEPPESLDASRPKRLLEYMRELERMAKLAPALVLPGHGETFAEASSLVAERLAFHRSRAATVHELLKAQPGSLWQLTRALFPELRTGMDFFLGLSEAQGHLDMLMEEKKVGVRSVKEVSIWESVD